MSTFNRCPNCGRKGEGGLFGGAFFNVYKCQKCKTLYCKDCGGYYCPNCGSNKKTTAGKCVKR